MYFGQLVRQMDDFGQPARQTSCYVSGRLGSACWADTLPCAGVLQLACFSDILPGTGVCGQLAGQTLCQVLVYVVSLLCSRHTRYWCIWSACCANIIPGTGVLVSLLGRHHARYWCIGQLAGQMTCKILVTWCTLVSLRLSDLRGQLFLRCILHHLTPFKVLLLVYICSGLYFTSHKVLLLVYICLGLYLTSCNILLLGQICLGLYLSSHKAVTCVFMFGSVSYIMQSSVICVCVGPFVCLMGVLFARRNVQVNHIQ